MTLLQGLIYFQSGYKDHWGTHSVVSELRRLAHLLGHARVPVLDAHEDALAVVVPRVAHVQGPPRVPERRARPATNVTRGELAGDFLEDVLEGVVREVTCVTGSLAEGPSQTNMKTH